MAILTMRSRKRFADVSLTAVLCLSALVLQVCLLNRFSYHHVICNLPLTVVIIWGAVFGSPLGTITADELRVSSLGQIFFRQVASGSLSGAIVGALVAALLSSSLPVYPITYPLTGWVAGYFCLRSFGRQTILIVPLVLILTAFAEMVMAAQLFVTGRPDVIDHLLQIIVPEALLNALVAPFIYLPLRSWYEYSSGWEHRQAER